MLAADDTAQAPPRPFAAPAAKASRGVRLLAWETGAVAAVLAVAGVLRFWAIGRQGFWFDEAHTGWMLRNGLGRMLAGVPRTESAPPLYYALAWFWVRVFGDTEVGLRSLSAVAGLATVPFAMATARAASGRRAGLICGVLLAVNPLLIWYSQEARAYSVLVLASTIALWLFVRARDRPSGPRLGAWAAAAIAAMWTHYFAAFLILPEALLLLGGASVSRRARAATALALALACVPLVAMAGGQSGLAYWIHNIPLTTRIRQVVEQFVVGFAPPASTPLALLGLALVAPAAVLLARVSRRERGMVIALAGVAGTSLALPLLGRWAGLDYFDGRNVVATLVPTAIVVAIGLSVRRARGLGLLLAAALTVLCVASVVRVWGDAGAQRPGWNRVAAVLGAPRAPRAILLTGGSASWAVPLAFHLRHTWWVPRTGARVRELDVVARLRTPAQCAGRAWWGPLCNIAPDHVSRRSPIAGFDFVDTRLVAGFAITRFRSAAPRKVFPRRPFLDPRLVRPTRRKRQLLLTPRSEPVIV